MRTSQGITGFFAAAGWCVATTQAQAPTAVARPTSGAAARGGACPTVSLESRPVTLPNGRLVAPQRPSIAEFAGALVVASAPGYVARSATDTLPERLPMLVMRVDGEGNGVLLDAPRTTGQAIQPVPFTDGHGRLHLVWAERAASVNPDAHAKALLHSVYDGARWSQVDTLVTGYAVDWGAVAKPVEDDATSLKVFGVVVRNTRMVSTLHVFDWRDSVIRTSSMKLGRAPAGMALVRAGGQTRLVAAWVSPDSRQVSDNSSLFVAASNDNGKSWTTPHRARLGGATGVGEPVLVLGSGRELTAFWRQPLESARARDALWASRSTDDGMSWSEPEHTPSEAHIAFLAMLQMALLRNGTPLIAFAQGPDHPIGLAMWLPTGWCPIHDSGLPLSSVAAMTSVRGEPTIAWLVGRERDGREAFPQFQLGRLRIRSK